MLTYDKDKWDTDTEQVNEFEGKFGKMPDQMTKFLYSCGSGYFFTDRTQAWPYEDCRCLGVLVRIERHGESLYQGA